MSALLQRARTAIRSLEQLHAPHLRDYHQPIKDVMPDVLLHIAECEARHEGLPDAVREASELLDQFAARLDSGACEVDSLLDEQIEKLRARLLRWAQED